ncbi:DUF1445 domain-containing protein [Ilyonectria sp. MPI-CAGE-AT-0026]|nr:DUF1445 domain-containing protein [Ilyonectria sp. MPI-CAGE-AT-0026]
MPGCCIYKTRNPLILHDDSTRTSKNSTPKHKMTTTTTTIAFTQSLTLTSPSLKTGLEARLAARSNEYTKSTSGLAPKHLQANLIVLPSRYASDFRDLCARNPVPCPLIAESKTIGDYSELRSHLATIVDGGKIASSLDIRTDCPRFNIYHDSKLVKAGVSDIVDQWTSDHVAFLIGCSYSFESALVAAGLPPRHAVLDRNVPMYRSNIPLNPAGVFTGGTYVVSMRPYKKADIEKIRSITRSYLPTHGECVAWGWDALEKLGIQDVDKPQWGDAPLTMDGRPLSKVTGNEEDVPVFWGCGVTPQEAVMKAPLEGAIMAHAPGHMLVLDCLEDDVLN